MKQQDFHCGCDRPHPTPNIPEMDEAKFVHNAVVVENADAVHHANNIQKAENVSEACNVVNAGRVDNSVNTTVLGARFKGVYSYATLNAKATAGDIKEDDFYKLSDGGLLVAGSINVFAGDIVVMKNGVWQFFYRSNDYLADDVKGGETKAVRSTGVWTAITTGVVKNGDSNQNAFADSFTNVGVKAVQGGVIKAALDKKVEFKGEATVVLINAMTSIADNVSYRLTTSGQLNNGNLDVTVGDVVIYTTIDGIKKWYLFVDVNGMYIQSFDSLDISALNANYDKGIPCLIEKTNGQAKMLYHINKTLVVGTLYFVFVVTEFSSTEIKEVQYYVSATDTSDTWHNTTNYTTKIYSQAEKTKLGNVPTLPTTAGNYQLKVEVSGDTVTYSWELVQ